MNHEHRIRNASLDVYRRAANGSKAAIAKRDADVRALGRRADLYPVERNRMITKARTTAEATIAGLYREALAEVAEMRSWSTGHTDTPPNGEALARRSYYSTRAQAELSGMPAADALAVIQKMAATASTDLDREAVQEYAAAARGRVPEGARRAVERAVESVDTGGARHWGAAVDAIEAQIGWLQVHTNRLMEDAGAPAAGAGGQERPPVDTRLLDLWRDGLEGHASAAFEASKAHAEDWSGVAAALPFAGSAGYDASGQDDTPASTPATDADQDTSSPAGTEDSQAVG